MVRKVRKYTSRHVPSKAEKEAAEAGGSRFLTEAEKDEIETDMVGGKSKLMAEADRLAEKNKSKKK